MKDRIIEFLRKENKSSAALAQEIGVQPSSVSHILSGRNKPSLDFIVKMVNRYPGLSLDWLIFGRGNMFTGDGITDLFASYPGMEKTSRQRDIFDSETDLSESPGEQPVAGSKESGGKQYKSVLSGEPRRARKIIIFYEDDSFTEHFPSGE